MRFRIPRNWAGTIGIALFGAAIVTFAFLLLVDIMQGHGSDPYASLFAWVFLPVLGTAGLLLFAVGHRLKERPRGDGDKRGLASLQNQQSALMMSGVVGAIVVFLMSAGGVRAIEFSESNEFCSDVCHPVMEPEGVAYKTSPHANVACVDCHVGSGTGNFVRAKMQGVRQLIAFMNDSYSRPIHTPIGLDSAVCADCHWPERDIGELPLSKRYYLTEGFDEPWLIEMAIKVGPGRNGDDSAGAHWHASMAGSVVYEPADEKHQSLASVTFTDAAGEQTVYRNIYLDLDDPDEDFHLGAPVEMDCISCHSRPAHRFDAPTLALNEAFDKGELDPNMPGVRWIGLELLAGEYETTNEAMTAIAETLPETVADEDPDWAADNAAVIEQAVLKLQDLFAANRSPEMLVKWNTHPNNTRHWASDGCFRCHAGNMVSDSGLEISSSCDTCHVIKGQGRIAEGTWQYDPLGLEFIHPPDGEVMNEPIFCSECHDGALGYGF